MPIVPQADGTYTAVREKLAAEASKYADSVEKYLNDVKY
jgi:hypothetical protein